MSFHWGKKKTKRNKLSYVHRINAEKLLTLCVFFTMVSFFSSVSLAILKTL